MASSAENARAAATRDERRLRRAAKAAGLVSTHWVGCWRVHHECAVAIIERLIDGAIDEAAMQLIDGRSCDD